MAEKSKTLKEERAAAAAIKAEADEKAALIKA